MNDLVTILQKKVQELNEKLQEVEQLKKDNPNDADLGNKIRNEFKIN
jgi:hypothetical protein